MCGRYTFTQPESVVSDYFQVPLPFDLHPRYNIAPGQTIVAVRSHQDSGLREWARLKWGLVPSWAKEPNIGYKMINARSETAFEKPSFRTPMMRRRCLIPADGYYEWKTVNKAKLAHFIRRPDKSTIALAGIWDYWEGPDGHLESAAILTVAANAGMATLHDRMPVILKPEDFNAWLNPKNRDISALRELLTPLPDEALEVTQVSSLVNKVTNEGAALIEPIDSITGSQVLEPI